ncbi:type II toxin-antitoxin system VapC family toxin [Pollutimonas subterranea]|nr:type II toxin-antitoxin system VapC family toxin [Pollutimonas subterranea]
MLDTNMVSHLIKGHEVVAGGVASMPMTSLCISAVTEGELHFGLAKRPEAKRLHRAVNELLKCVDVLPWDSAVAQTYGLVRAGPESRGRPLGSLDMMIAAHAVCTDSILVTNDSAFHQVPRLNVEDWLRPANYSSDR